VNGRGLIGKGEHGPPVDQHEIFAVDNDPVAKPQLCAVEVGDRTAGGQHAGGFGVKGMRVTDHEQDLFMSLTPIAAILS